MERDAEVEKRIAALIAAGDLERAATEALRSYGPEILNYLTLVLRDEEASYDVFSQFGEDLWRGIADFRFESRFKTWAFRLASHAAHRFRRDAYRRRVRPLKTQEVSRIAAEVRSSVLGYRKIATRDRLARIRERLEPEEQALLTLRVDQEFSWKEIAAMLSEPDHPIEAATLRKRFERLRQKLRELAREHGL